LLKVRVAPGENGELDGVMRLEALDGVLDLRLEEEPGEKIDSQLDFGGLEGKVEVLNWKLV
jgi:hypothetical protein